jgi:hypothetical protein
MTEYQKQTAFLRRIMQMEDSDECRHLEKRITQALRDERCIQCATWWMALFTLLAAAGLAYGAALFANFPYNESQVVTKVVCVLGLASLICLVTFLGLLMNYRIRMNRLRDECRRLVIRVLESSLRRLLVPHSQERGGEMDQGAVEGNGAPDGQEPLRELGGLLPGLRDKRMDGTGQ